MFEGIAASWPSDFSGLEAKLVSSSSSLPELASAVRAGSQNPQRVQSALLARHALKIAEQEDCEILLCWHALNQSDSRTFDCILDTLKKKNPRRLEVRVLTIISLLLQNKPEEIASLPFDIWKDLEEHHLLLLCKAAYYLNLGDIRNAASLLKLIPTCICPEMAMLSARICAKNGNIKEAIRLLMLELDRVPNHIKYHAHLLDYLFDGKDSVNVMPVTIKSLSRFGENSEILYHFTALNLLKRQPGLARRSALLQQVASSVRPTPLNLANQLATYEANGQPDWMQFLRTEVGSKHFLSSEPLLQSNLVMQLASTQSEKYPIHLNSLVHSIKEQPGFINACQNSNDFLESDKYLDNERQANLKIGWITGDCNYHPVSRFLYGWFAACSGRLSHQHCLVSLEDHKSESYCDLFRSLPGLSVLDASSWVGIDRLNNIRKQEYDVVIDLSGWTGGNFVAGFLARLAPVQVNYLGYFATSGLPSMDFWLGDSELFPSGHSEWSTESLWRLPRPFLAWSPHGPLPEANASVCEAPSGPIRFGSFNHNRKLSDPTLRLWGQLLDAVPGSRLVLKASAETDSDTQRLLRRRMLRQGLDPDRVDWLALTKGPLEHLAQYAQIDIALDPIPNGGCTTTCEAMWMGVPTITLAGSHYVSRMSTAVLAGANMNEWIAQDLPEYINLAREHAVHVSKLRANRDHWRRQLLSSPLGDAADLIHHLEDAFSQMNAQMLNKA